MYKYIFYPVLALFVLSCTQEIPDNISQKDDYITLSFQTNVAYDISTRNAITDNAINELQLLVFDQDGLFLSKETAVMQQQATSEGKFSVTLPQSSDKRIIHFIAGYDWSNFDETALQGKSELELIPSLTCVEGISFWYRQELLLGISENALAGNTIDLIRNRAKVTITNEETRLKDASFAIYNKPSKGTVAPFNLLDKDFNLTNSNGEVTITEPAGMSYSLFDTDFLPADGVSSSYLFERTNFGSAGQVSPEALFIIIKGKYGGESKDTYYKIDLHDKQTLKQLNVLRNYWYKVTITEVGFKGYDSLQEALNSPASNNLTSSLILQKYPSITNNEYALTVEETNVIFIRDNESLSLMASYTHISTNNVDNTQISLYEYIEQNPANPVFKNPPVYSPGTGLLTGELNDVIPGVTRVALVTLRGGDLLRQIKVVLTEPLEFKNMRFTPDQVSPIIGYPTELQFEVPESALEYLPFTCIVTANGLSPGTDRIESSPTNNSWEYLYKVEHTGAHQLPFKANSAVSTEMVKLEAELFRNAYAAYTNSGMSNMYQFNDVRTIPDRVPFYTNRDVELKFIVASTETVTITTDYLLAKSGQPGVIQESGYITFTPSAIGEQTIYLSTKEKNNGGKITLESADHRLKEIDLKSQLVKISGTLTVNGTPATHRHPTQIHDLTIGCRFYIVRGYDPIFKKIDEIVGSFQTNLDANGNPVGTYETQIEADLDEVLYLIYTDRQFSGTNLSLPEWISAYTTIDIDSPIIDKTHNFPYTPPGGG